MGMIVTLSLKDLNCFYVTKEVSFGGDKKDIDNKEWKDQGTADPRLSLRISDSSTVNSVPITRILSRRQMGGTVVQNRRNTEKIDMESFTVLRVRE